MDGLQVLNFHPSKYVIFPSCPVCLTPLISRVMAHPRVLAWQDRVEGERLKYTTHTAELPDEFDEFDTPEAIQSYWDINMGIPD